RVRGSTTSRGTSLPRRIFRSRRRTGIIFRSSRPPTVPGKQSTSSQHATTNGRRYVREICSRSLRRWISFSRNLRPPYSSSLDRDDQTNEQNQILFPSLSRK